jgi:tetratricopeptide (TPR) repeat protein
VSSTYSDLVEHRQQVYDILRKMRYDVMAMEDYVATDKRPLDKCLADVASCDVYVGIFAWRYGYVPPSQERSITELEYRQAGQSGLERLIFLLHEDAPWPRSKMESGVCGEKTEALRAELAREHTVQFFKSPEELAGEVADSVAEWAQAQLDASMGLLRARRDQADSERREMRERQRVVNLRPLDAAHFKDRLREIQALCDHLADASVRLVSVVGRGGMGKTALACRILADLERGNLPIPGEERELPIDGILYLSTRSTGLGLERIYTDVGRMLGEPAASRLAARWADRDASLEFKVETLLETMRDGLYLILLDNLEEELTEEGAIAEEGLRLFVERCLTQPGGVRLVATSREEVRLAADALYGTRSIPLREGLPEDEGIALLRDLDPQGTLGLQDAPEDDLRHAARLTRGIPRALEILAGILHEDPTASLSELLADDRLFGEQVVERLVATSYHRLGEDKRRGMEALAVLDRPVDETAIAYLLHPWFPGLDMQASLRRLVSGYFVSASRVTGEYSLHPLDREYAYHRLPDGDEPDACNRRNLELRAADFYAGLRKPESEWKTIDDLAPQLAEFEHRVHAGDYDGACRVLEPIDLDYLYLWGHYARLVELSAKLVGRLRDPSLQVVNLGSMGNIHYGLGQFKQAKACHQQALKISREIGDKWNVGRQLGGLGRVCRVLRQYKRAVDYSQQALSIARMVGDRHSEVTHLGNLSVTHRNLWEYEQAIEYNQQALSVAREIGDRRGESYHLVNLGVAYLEVGKVEAAIEYCQQTLTIAHELGDRRREVDALGNLGRARWALGQTREAIEFFEEALAITREIGDRRWEGRHLRNLGQAYYVLKQVERAIRLYEESLAIAREIGYHPEQSRSLLGLGRALLITGELFKANQRCREALALDMPKTSYRAALILGIVLLHQRDPAAVETFADAIARCRAMLDKTAGLYGARYALAAALVGSAVCDPRWSEEDERAGLLAPALTEYRRALENCAAPGVVGDAIRDLEMIQAASVEGLEPAFELLTNPPTGCLKPAEE